MNHMTPDRFRALDLCVLSLLASLTLAAPAVAAEPLSLELVQTIPLKGAAGRLDHLALDVRGKRLFIANLSNNSLDVVDLKAGKLVKQVPGSGRFRGSPMSRTPTASSWATEWTAPATSSTARAMN